LGKKESPFLEMIIRFKHQKKTLSKKSFSEPVTGKRTKNGKSYMGEKRISISRNDDQIQTPKKNPLSK